MNAFEQAVFDNSFPDLAQIINTTDAGLWAIDLATEKVTWSLGFYRSLGYEPGEIACSAFNFVENILYHQDKDIFLASVKESNVTPRAIHIRLLTKTGYEWFQSTTRKHAGPVVSGTLINVHSYRSPLLKAEAVNSEMLTVAGLAKLASWEMNAFTKCLLLSEGAMEILQLTQAEIALNQFFKFIEPAYYDRVHAAFDTCVRIGRPFELDVQLKTARNRTFWIKIKAVGMLDNQGQCQQVKGIIQDIHLMKQREEDLSALLKTVSHQNSRFQNFTHIAAHNLRSYVGNLQFMIDLYENADYAGHDEVFTHIKTIGNSLNATIEHLNEIIKIDFEVSGEKTLTNLEAIFENAVNALQSTIQATKADITWDFTRCPSVFYLPAYLESIFHNLLSNALKYRHPDRVPKIYCESKVEDGHIYLTVEDNGLGIDLEKYGHKVFGMYQIFHSGDNAQGIGLFITRNQVEAMGGRIDIESRVNVGTKFTIMLT
jgi:signal transduction histidine kinase